MMNPVHTRTSASRRVDDHVIRPSDERLLRALLHDHFLTPEQVTRLLFAHGAKTYVYAKLNRLAQGGHVQAIPMLRPQRRGSSRLLYALARSGLAHLRELGVAIPPQFRFHEPKRHSYLYYDHEVALADVLVAAELLPRAAPQLGLEALVHDRELARQPVLVPAAGGIRQTLVPDGYLAVRVAWPDGRATRFPVALEIDRGTVDRQAWQARTRAYLAGYGEGHGPLLDAFGVTSLTVAVVAPDAARRDQLAGWIAAVLREEGRIDLAALFLLTSADPARVSPEDFFLGPVWSDPLGGAAMPLVEPPRPLLVAGKGAG
jgi:hypothetical protein